jgi:pyrophosphate--fructose-6-phosphate 1-phosphotransferase
LKAEGKYSGNFNPQAHFLGYEGRCSLPSNFDSQYCYSLGYAAALLIQLGCSSYMSAIHNLACPVEEWQAGGVPLTMMMNLEQRHGQLKPVIRKALVDLKGKAFTLLKEEREKWAAEDVYRSPGPIQFFGDRELTDEVPITLRLRD